jgi:hypothetical protein
MDGTCWSLPNRERGHGNGRGAGECVAGVTSSSPGFPAAALAGTAHHTTHRLLPFQTTHCFCSYRYSLNAFIAPHAMQVHITPVDLGASHGASSPRDGSGNNFSFNCAAKAFPYPTVCIPIGAQCSLHSSLLQPRVFARPFAVLAVILRSYVIAI